MRIDLSEEEFMAMVQIAYTQEPPDTAFRLLRQIVDRKVEAQVRHDLYTKSKIDPSASEREAARQQYLDRAGITQDFRWPEGFKP